MRLGLAKTYLLPVLFELHLSEVMALHQIQELFKLLDVLGEIHSEASHCRLQLNQPPRHLS